MDFEKLRDAVQESENVTMYMVHVGSTKLTTISPTIELTLQNDIKEIINSNINSYIDCTSTDYNLIGSDDDVIEITTVNEYKKYIDKIVDSFSDTKPMPTNFGNASFNYFVYEIENKERSKQDKEPIYFFRRTKKLSTFKKGFYGHLIEGHFQSLKDKNFLGVDDYIDFVIFGNDICIFEHISFERILKLKNEFKEGAKKVFDNELIKQKILNYEDLRDKALAHGNFVKRLYKIHENGDGALFLKNLEQTQSVIEKFNLQIKFESGKFIYDNPDQIGDFINLMQDAYYTTLIAGVDGVDTGR